MPTNFSLASIQAASDHTHKLWEDSGHQLSTPRMSLAQRSGATVHCALRGAHQRAFQAGGPISVAARPLGGPALAAAPRRQRLQRRGAAVSGPLTRAAAPPRGLAAPRPLTLPLRPTCRRAPGRLPPLAPQPSQTPMAARRSYGSSMTFGSTTTQAGTRPWRLRGWRPRLCLMPPATHTWCCRAAAQRVRWAGARQAVAQVVGLPGRGSPPSAGTAGGTLLGWAEMG